MKKIKIAELVWPDVLTPPKSYGPINLVAARVANGLYKKGYDVTSFAAKGSKVAGKIIEIETPGPSDSILSDPNMYHFVTIAEFLKRKDDFDIIHSHIGYASIILLDIVKKPVVITLHGNYKNTFTPDIYRKYAKKAHFVAISEAQRKTLPGVDFIGTVYHGANTEEYFFEDNVKDYMVYVGRTSPEKGIGDAIKIAIKLKIKLKIAAHIDSTDTGKKYYQERIQPYLKNKYIEFLGELSQEEVKILISKAKLFLYPISIFEPFGLVVIEANASGTPVVTFETGAMPEIIKNSVNGFVLERGDFSGMEKTIKNIYSMSREEYAKLRLSTRDWIKKNFSIEKMVDGYDAIFRKLMK